jgi:hypothetical protein
MAINLSSEKYDFSNSLSANVGDWVKGELEFSTTVEHAASENNKMFYRDATGNGAGVYELEWSSGDWEAEGFSQGDEIEIQVVLSRLCGATFVPGVTTKYIATIAYIDSDPKKVILTGPLALAPGASTNYPVIPFANFATIIAFPGSSGISPSNCAGGQPLRYEYQETSIRKLNRPAEIEFFFNLAPNSSTAQASVVNGQVNRFKHILPIVADFSSNSMTQLNNPSGGYFKNVTIQQIEDLGATTKWKINYEFLQWGLVEDGFAEPDYYNAADCLAPIGNLKVYANSGNPNGILEANTSNNLGNTGGFNEIYNGGQNPFSVVSVEWFNSLGASISALDYSAESSFKAIVETGGTQTPLHGYKLGLAYRPEDASIYNTSNFSLGNNLMINAPENLFRPDGVLDPTVYPGEASVNANNSGFDFSEIKIDIVGTTIEIEGKVIPKAGNQGYFSSIPDGGRKTSIWLSISTDPAFLGVVQTPHSNNKVSLLLFNEDNIDAPIVGVQIPGIVSEELFDHDLNLITDNSVDNTTTEDDILYKSEFLLPTGVVYDGMRTKISAFNPVTLEEFELESNYLSFGNVAIQSGVMQINESISRNFNLPPTTDRNEISIKRKPSLDSVGFAGYELNYGFLNDWRYWLLQSNVDSFFYDPLEPNNGRNKNWQKFYTGDWLLRLSYYTDLEGIEDFNNYSFKIRPYEDDIDVVESTTLTVLSNGTNPTALVANEIIEIESIFTWVNIFADEWVEFTVEDFESGNRWVISSVLDQGNIAANPLKPTAGNTKIEVAGSGTNVLTCKALIDTSLISANKVCLSYRVYSSPNDSGGSVGKGKKKTDGTYKKKTQGPIKQKA